MREPRPDWSPLEVNFKILDEHPHLFIFESPSRGGGGGANIGKQLLTFLVIRSRRSSDSLKKLYCPGCVI